jgi:hypothetical protein
VRSNAHLDASTIGRPKMQALLQRILNAKQNKHRRATKQHRRSTTSEHTDT